MPRPLLPLLAAAFAAIALTAGTAAAAPGDPSEAGLSDLDRLVRWFEEHPEKKFQRGTGWNPLQRALWFVEQRRVDGRDPAPGARWEAWQETRSRSAGIAPRAAWFEIGPVNLSGRILSLAFDPNDAATVYVGSASGGLWKSTDGGDTWTTTTEELPTLAIGGVCVSPLDSNVVLIATGEGTPNSDRVGGVGILKSTDAGQTWATTSLTYAVDSYSGFHCLEANPVTGTLLAGANDGLWRSTDEGDNWTRIQTGDFWDVKWKPGTNRVYAVGGGYYGGGNSVQVSTDDGASWSNLTSGLPSASQIGKSKIALCASIPTTVYLHLSSSATYETLGIYRSTNDGASWSVRNSSQNIGGGQAWYNLTLAVDPDNSNIILAGGVEIFRSQNGGTTFQEVGDGYGLGTDTAIHWDHHAIAYEPGSGSNVWCGTDGGVWKSTNDGSTWFSRREGIATYQFYDICAAQSDPSAILGGTQDNGVPGRQGSSGDWFTSTLFADGMVCNVDPTNANVVYAEWQRGNQVKSTNAGASWFDIQNGLPSNAGAWVTPVAMDRNNPTTLFCSVSNRIYRTTNGGSSWSNMHNHDADWIDVSPVSGLVVWSVSGTSRPYLSTDGGTAWIQVSDFPFVSGSATKILAHPTDPNTVFVTFSGYTSAAHVARSTNLGLSWTDVTGDLPDEPVNAIAVDPQFPDDWYVGTDVGVWQSTNGGVSWVPFDSGLPNAVVADLEIRDAQRKLVAGTHGRGAFEIALSSPGTGADVTAAAPYNLMLDPPSPNPLSRATMLRFAARHEGTVSLDVYDVGGRLVSHLAELPTGDGIIRRMPWVAEDVPAGVYFAVLRAGEAQVTRKLVVAK